MTNLCIFVYTKFKDAKLKNFKIFILLFLSISSCNTKKEIQEFVIAFGSCNNQILENTLWEEIKKNEPDVWIWGGDNIYSDTEDMNYLKQNYLRQKRKKDYTDFIKNVDVLGTWDDHDYGMNDGGFEYIKKEESQQLFLDFMDVKKNDKRRLQKGVYFSKEYKFNEKSIKIILLDTRYFRTALTPDNETDKRYKPNEYGEGTILGETQWEWLKNELKNSTSSFNIIVSSIQFLSFEHGFETWGNMPHEVDKLENLITSTKAKNVIILSGDRHISEISKKQIEGNSYPLIDFTSSGLTHSYTDFNEEINPYRVGNVISKKSFGILKFERNSNAIRMEARGENNVIYEFYLQNYN